MLALALVQNLQTGVVLGTGSYWSVAVIGNGTF